MRNLYLDQQIITLISTYLIIWIATNTLDRLGLPYKYEELKDGVVKKA